MKKITHILLTFVTIIATASCSQVDLTEVNSRISSLDARISALEGKISSINTSIADLQRIVNNLKDNIYVTSVVTINDVTTISFSNNTSVTIQSGKNGKDAPMLGIEKYNGVYYWTLDGQWLLDDYGQRLPVTGKDGKDGRDGADGKDGKDGSTGGIAIDGRDGRDGVNGITPIIGVDGEGFWTISYDNGQTYSRIRNANGEYVCAVASVSEVGDSIFKSIKEYDDYVILTLLNGSSIELEKFKDLRIEFEQSEGIEFENGMATVGFTLTGADENTKIVTIDKGNVASSATIYSDRSGGYVSVKSLDDQISADAKVIVMLYNKRHTITNTLTFVSNMVPLPPGIKPYLPIYYGNEPPVVEGAYWADLITVYCQDEGHGGYSPGTVMTPEIYKFYNQNLISNRIDVKNKTTTGSSYEEGSGYYISGKGNDFTIYANLEGESRGIRTVTSVIISGTVATGGIKNFYHAFIMQEKGPDPNHYLMEEGVFRVFKDDFAETTTWDDGTKSNLERDSRKGFSLDKCFDFNKYQNCEEL